MASYPVTVFRWDDPGAPQLVNGTISSFFNVLQKCLVEGYGTKDPLGWTRSFYDPVTFKAAWRNNIAAGGSGGSAYFYSNTNTNANQTIIRLTHCKSIDAAGVTVGQGRVTAAQFTTAINRWVLIGTTIGFYFYSFGATVTANGNGLINNGDTRPSFYAGDIFSILPNDAGRFILLSDTIDSSDNTSITANRTFCQLSQSPESSVGCVRFPDADNANSIVSYGYISAGISIRASNDNNSITLLTKLSTNLVFAAAPVYSTLSSASPVDRLGGQYKNSLVSPSVRGVLPGLRMLYLGVGFGQSLPFINIEDDTEYHSLPSAAGSTSSIVIIQSNGEWYDPFA